MTIDSVGSVTSSRGVDRAAAPGSAASDAAAATNGVRTPAIATDTANAVKGAAPVPTLDQVTQAVSQLNKAPQTQSQGLEFSIDQDSKRTVVKVIDQSTKEVLRQFPTEEALQMAKSLDAASSTSSKGFLLKQTA
jgi:flagellar protein FlaG